MKSLFSVLALSGCLLTGFTVASLAEGLPGVTLFGNVQPENQLPFRLDFGGVPSVWDRYRLRIPSKKVKLAIAQIAISYPDYYQGEFDPKAVAVALTSNSSSFGGPKILKRLPIQEVNWDKENRMLLIYLKEPIPASSNVEIILSNVLNPSPGGIFNFNCQIQTPGDLPLLRYIGTWILNIG
ncbi:hypothetical protein DO97_21180 [Neosynechococcus sphagnicola sy1]|uniref:DUF2808 domain-containing protein n=2 Tax=Neosynechococcus TaxID=1501143 RepID=A0A098TM36_9CYAN|nr:hypothetical protein DO97_21180 [Neosynechococcus sphagnicola sy1]